MVNHMLLILITLRKPAHLRMRSMQVHDQPIIQSIANI